MAEKLSITIGLEGGKELERQLADIGKAGQQAFLDIAKAAEQAGGFKNLNPEEVTNKLKTMGVVGEDAFKKIQDAVAGATRVERLVGIVQKVEQGFAGLRTAALGFARALGPIGIIGAFVGEQIVSAMLDAAKAINEVDKAAIKAGMSIKEFDTLRQGFEAMSLSAKDVAAAMGGIGAAAEKAKLDVVATAFKQLQEAATRGFGGIGTDQLKLLVETAQGVGPAADAAKKALEQLGVTVNLPARTLQDFIQKTGDASRGTAAFVESLRQMPDSAQRSALAIDGFGAAGAALVQALRSGLITQDQFKERLSTISETAVSSANLIEQSFNRSSTAFERFKSTGDISQLGTVFTETATRVAISFSQMGEEISALGGKIAELASSIGGDIWAGFQAAGTAAIDAIVGAFDFLINKIREAAGWLAQFFSSGGGGGAAAAASVPGMAGGGLLGGRGTGTSDSNLAWVSRGEHIMPAGAVRQPGVLAFLEALRRSGGNLSRVLDRMGHFATGGLVSMPAFAGGGSVGGMSHVTIQFPGLPAIGGLRASSEVVDELRKAAAMAQVRSGGRKPSRYT